MFLPYYVAQSVGWVYLRKSFSSLDYYRNFKDDYLDYYLGIESSIDRLEKQKLENESKGLAEELSFYTSMADEDDDIQLAKLIDEEYSEKSRAYIESHQSLFDVLLKSEKEYVKKCNELSYYQQRQSVLRNVSTNHKQQKPKEGICPVCTQNLPYSTEEVYKYFQEVNDTDKEKLECKVKVKDIQSSINSLKNKIIKLRADITTEYSILKKLSKKELTYEEWLKIKAKTKLLEEIDSKVGKLTIQKGRVDEKLAGFKTEKVVQKLRNKKDQEFKTTFLNFLTDDLGVKASDEDRHSKLYKVSSFPSQGVELHKTVLGYHFAFNHLISQTSGIHQFPFLLDAVFKEDIDSENKRKIIKFIADNTPKETQLFFSVANTLETEGDINAYNSTFFKGEAKLICMGDSKRERSFLKSYDGSLTEYIDKTFDIMESK